MIIPAGWGRAFTSRGEVAVDGAASAPDTDVSDVGGRRLVGGVALDEARDSAQRPSSVAGSQLPAATGPRNTRQSGRWRRAGRGWIRRVEQPSHSRPWSATHPPSRPARLAPHSPDRPRGPSPRRWRRRARRSRRSRCPGRSCGDDAERAHGRAARGERRGKNDAPIAAASMRPVMAAWYHGAQGSGLRAQGSGLRA